MVTRTFATGTAEVKVLNKNTETVEVVTVQFRTVSQDDKKVAKLIKSLLPAEFLYISSTTPAFEYAVYGMSDDEFFKHATPQKRAPKLPKEDEKEGE